MRKTEAETRKKITINDKMQKGHYYLTEPAGRNFDPEGKKGHDPKLNYFGVDASLPLKEWERKGWIHPADPSGWFQWYCRYYCGRRMPDEDQRQIKRWKAISRHIGAIKKLPASYAGLQKKAETSRTTLGL